MRFSELIAVAISTAPLVSAFSLYDTAPVVGVPESHAAEYFFSVRGGYDTNPKAAVNNKHDDAGCFVNAALSSTYADVESVDKLSYSVRLGGTRYIGTSGNENRKYYGDCSLDVALEHAFSAMSRYTGRAHVSYMPEPGYDNGFSSAGMRGDTLSWNLDNTYSEAMDARWSWNLGCNVSGTKYEQKTESYDDRQYYSASLGLNYRESDRLTYTSSASFRQETCVYSMDSRSAFGSFGVRYALDSVSTASVSVGAQCKMMDGRTTANPTLDVGYRRRVTDGLSVNGYVKYSDENVNNYSRTTHSSYRSCATWRLGAYGTYVLSPDVSYNFGVQIMDTQYRKATNKNVKSSARRSFKPHIGMNYHFTPTMTGSLTAEYTYYHYDRGGNSSMYNRWQYSAGISYRF